MSSTVERAREIVKRLYERNLVSWNDLDREVVFVIQALNAEVQRLETLAQDELCSSQEPVGYEHHEYRPFGAPSEIRIHAVLKSQYLSPNGLVAGDFQWLIDQYKTNKTTIKLIPLYTAPPEGGHQ